MHLIPPCDRHTKNNIGQRSFSINDSVVFLKNTYRFSENSGIKLLSESIRKGDTKNLFKILNNNNLIDVRWVSDLKLFHDAVVDEFGVNLHKDVINAKDFFEISKQKKILCAIRNGFYGVAQLNDTIEKRIKIIEGVSENREWYDGRIILSTKNDNMTGIRNGEQGICSLIDGQYYVVFENQQDHSVPVQKLNSYEAAYATTIHKSQGSEFENVVVILPSKDNFGHVSRELLYTSVTRARKSVLLVGNQDMITHAVNNPITRNSGLAFKLR